MNSFDVFVIKGFTVVKHEQRNCLHTSNSSFQIPFIFTSLVSGIWFGSFINFLKDFWTWKRFKKKFKTFYKFKNTLFSVFDFLILCKIITLREDICMKKKTNQNSYRSFCSFFYLKKLFKIALVRFVRFLLDSGKYILSGITFHMG